ncbi:FAD-dependent monooxygenase [Streptomonospora nanhaiensis]|uniref:FAD-dependent monooxygenase n=1 Tax=Streptomonospora nanhaiensis TaxID=1323731 RepID=UPI001C391F3F|nr:FAD-dependent monooxygenase [Streptomonospora nanhaiensis]MBV2362972.1 FAD-dependent monooxygenase [Streptomonospora nanhaiensis]
MSEHSSTETGTDVLVVGAGGTGLALAAGLARRGVRVRVVEKAPALSPVPKALGVQARTLEVLEDLGVVPRMVAEGLPMTAMHIRSERRPVADIDLSLIDSGYPYLLMLPQSAVERILADRLAEDGVAVEHGVELTGFTDTGAHVAAVLRHADGRTETVRAGWLAGADGAHSTVRHLLGIPFEGTALEENFATADIGLDWPLGFGDGFAFLDRGRPAAFFPLPEGRYRMVIAYPPGADPGGEVTRAEMQAQLDRLGVPGARVTDFGWSARFRVNQRLSARHSAGRVFLTGDAAHIHSPVGAQGMNTGIQDAVNLAWKLAAHITGGAPRDLLDTYHQERGAVARRLVAGTTRFTRLTLLHGTVTTMVRRAVAPRVLGRGPVQQRLTRAISQLDVAYPDSALNAGAAPSGGPAPGERAPYTGLFGPAAGPGCTLLVFTGYRGAADPEVRAGVGELTALAQARPGVAVEVAAPEGDDGLPGVRHDASLEAHRRFGLTAGGYALVRPDGYIAVVGALGDTAALRGHLDRWFPRAASAPTAGPRRQAG